MASIARDVRSVDAPAAWHRPITRQTTRSIPCRRGAQDDFVVAIGQVEAGVALALEVSTTPPLTLASGLRTRTRY
ncbi:MAG: hypothetical protein R3A10_04360 [Caldilineaceae bacterium]